MATLQSPFKTILNFRDVGSSVNQLSGRRLMKPGLLYRSARTDQASSEDREQCQASYGVKTTIDLRTDSENASKEAKDAARSREAVPAVTNKFVNLNGDAYQKALLKRLTWPQYIKLIYLVSTFRRIAGIRVLGLNVLSQRGLQGLACDTLQHSTKEIFKIFSILSQRSSYPVHLFCQQGKDRTGLVMILVQLLLNIPEQTIRDDYMLSESELELEKDERLQELQEMGLPVAFAGCDAELVPAVARWLYDQHGSVERYMSSIGIDKAMQESTRSLLAQG